MKKSNIIIIIIIGVCMLAIFGTIIASRIVLTSDSWVTRSGTDGTTIFASSQSITEVIGAGDFTGIATRGSWEVKIEHGAGYRVEVTAPENVYKHLEIRVEGEELQLRMNSDTRFRGSYKPIVTITMPHLNDITSAGQLEFAFDGFDGDTLSLHSSGVVTATGENSSFALLRIEADGVANLELEGTVAESAYVDMGGVGNALLSLGSGELKGSLRGVYQLSYKGKPSLVDVDAGGLSNVSRMSK